jgi:hypothetical protein
MMSAVTVPAARAVSRAAGRGGVAVAARTNVFERLVQVL